MKRRALRRFGVAIALVVTPLAAACGGNDAAEVETTELPAPPPATETLSVNELTLGTAIDANRQVTNEAETFAPTDTIYASVATTSSDPASPQRGQLTARWTYEGNQAVDETSQAFDFTGTGATAFKISKPDGWPTGNYRVEILHDGEVVQTRDFEVR